MIRAAVGVFAHQPRVRTIGSRRRLILRPDVPAVRNNRTCELPKNLDPCYKTPIIVREYDLIAEWYASERVDQTGVPEAMALVNASARRARARHRVRERPADHRGGRTIVASVFVGIVVAWWFAPPEG
jgi:hypothetical protein